MYTLVLLVNFATVTQGDACYNGLLAHEEACRDLADATGFQRTPAQSPVARANWDHAAKVQWCPSTGEGRE